MGTRLNGKGILITGSTSNIGRAIAVRAAEESGRVVVSGRDPDRGHEVVRQIRERGGWAHFVPAVLDGSAASANDLVARATDRLEGPVGVLVNNAGVFPGDSTVRTDEATFDEVIAVNVRAPFFLTAAVAPHMVEQGTGAIINIGSWVARLGIPAGSAYAASKGALETLTRAWAAEFGPSGVRVNAVSPGVIVEQPSADDPRLGFVRGIPAGRLGHPDAVAWAVVYLASDEASYVHGAVIDVDGGRVTSLIPG